MTRRLLQAALVPMLAACGTSNGSTAQRPFTTTEVATFDSPWAMGFLPKSNLALVTEKPGRLWLVDVTTGHKREVAAVPKVHFEGQAGLLDVVLAPAFGTNDQVYFTYSEPSPDGGSGLALARARLVRDGAARLDGLQVLWRDPEGGRGGQFGAIIVFAPDGKSLFLSSGERQRFTPAQESSSPLGKILRLTLDGKPAPGNPAAGRIGAPSVSVTDPPQDTEAAKHTAGRRIAWPGTNLTPAETWSTGHRNPYGLTFDSAGRLWETEMGPKGGDEVNLILPGRNYGWAIVSNGDNYDGVPIARHSTRPEFEAPKVWWNPSISPTSLLIYTGKLFHEWRGNGFIGTLTGKGLIRVTFDGDTARKADEWDMPRARIRFVGEGPDGAIYLLEDGAGGRLLRLTPAK
jgi:glucose/arabinose dehydrogenase